jgi:transposase
MRLRKYSKRRRGGGEYAYWALVESYRTARGPRERVVAYLGDLAEETRRGVQAAAQRHTSPQQMELFDDGGASPEWVEIDVNGVRLERCRDYGGPWLGLQLMRQLELPALLARVLPRGREGIPWSVMAQVLVLCRLCEPSSELHIAEHYYGDTALPDLLGVPARQVNDDRLYRSLDALLPHKDTLESHLRDRLGTLFGLEYDLLLYDVTSTYFEGQARRNPKAQRGHSRDHRGDCKQVCLGLVVTRDGMPLGYEVFAGNRNDVTTLQPIIERMEARYGMAQRIWVLDRGMISEDNIAFLKQCGRRYIVGTPKSLLRRFERELLDDRWETLPNGVEVQRCAAPDGDETFILCRSQPRRDKEAAMHERAEERIEAELERIGASCQKRRYTVATIATRVGRLLGRNSRAAGLFDIDVSEDDDGRAGVRWSKKAAWRDWARLSEGCYLLRSNISDWSASELWHAYVQLTEAETAFRIHKSDLKLRPVWHQREDRVEAHILVCFLAYVLWKTLGQLCRRAGLGDEPRKVFEEIGKLRLVDVILPTRNGLEIRRRRVTTPNKHQRLLLQRLGLGTPGPLLQA